MQMIIFIIIIDRKSPSKSESECDESDGQIGNNFFESESDCEIAMEM